MVAISDDLSFVESHGERLKLESPARSSKKWQEKRGKKERDNKLTPKHQWSHLGFSLQRKQQQWNRWPEVPSDFFGGFLPDMRHGIVVYRPSLGRFQGSLHVVNDHMVKLMGQKSCEVVAGNVEVICILYSCCITPWNEHSNQIPIEGEETMYIYIYFFLGCFLLVLGNGVYIDQANWC